MHVYIYRYAALMSAPLVVKTTLQHLLPAMHHCSRYPYAVLCPDIQQQNYTVYVLAGTTQEQADAGLQYFLESIPTILHLAGPVPPQLQVCLCEHRTMAAITGDASNHHEVLCADASTPNC